MSRKVKRDAHPKRKSDEGVGWRCAGSKPHTPRATGPRRARTPTKKGGSLRLVVNDYRRGELVQVVFSSKGGDRNFKALGRWWKPGNKRPSWRSKTLRSLVLRGRES